MARNTIIKVRVTEEDKEAFIALAKARGVDLSKLIRSLLKGQGQ
jgi:antitoxin component of RelBE/YafQ-DinJ toxin-antitoxin module